MPGPSRWRGEAAILAASNDKFSPTALDDRARAVLQFVKDCQASGIEENAPEGQNDTPETAAVLRKLAADSIVLLKNENKVLPLNKDKRVGTHAWIPIAHNVTNRYRLWSLAPTPSSRPTAAAARPR